MQKDGIIYLHGLIWPADGKLAVTDVDAVAAYSLKDSAKQPLPITRSSGIVRIQGPTTAPDPHDLVIVPVDRQI